MYFTEHKSNAESTQHSPIFVYTDPSSKNVVILSQCDETGHHESAEPMQESLHLALSNEKEIPKNAQQEAELLTSQKEFPTCDCNCMKHKKLEELYLKSERSRILMKKNHNRLQVIMKRKIMKLEKIIHTYLQ